MTISRRSHPKSRSGCKTCKARKVKCDENKPACRNCIKHQVKCDFLADRNFSSLSAASSPAPSNGLGSTGLNMADLELLHNYTTLTYATLTEEPGMRDYYRVNLVQMGFRYEYIMRTLLSLSALHIAHYRRQSTDHYVSLGMAHHQAASRTVMDLMLNINAENAPMLFLFSNLTMFFALGAPRQESDFLLVGESGFPDWIQLLRGVHLFQPYLTEESKTGELGPILQDGGRRWLALMTAKLKDKHQPAKQHLDLLARSVRQAFSSLRCGSSNHNSNGNSNNSNGGSSSSSSSSTSSNNGAGDGLVETEEDRDRLLTTYLNAIEMLGRCFAIFHEPPPIWDHAILPYGRFDARLAFIWLFEMTDGLLPLLRIPTQEAAVLMAFFAALLNKATNQWWIKGWPEHLIARIYALLDEEHRLWISWPMQEMGWMPSL